MKTQVIIKKGWKIIKEYDFLITMVYNDVVSYNGLEYKVDCSVLDIDANLMIILID